MKRFFAAIVILLLASISAPAWAEVNLATCNCTLQEALDTGEPVYAPEGAYTLDTTIKLDPKAVIVGDGYKKTIFTYTGTGNALEPRDQASFIDFVRLEKFTLNGQGLAGTRGIFMPSSRHWHLSHLEVRNFGHSCIHLYGQRNPDGTLAPGDSTYNYFEHVRLGIADYPLFLGGTPGETRIKGGTSNLNTFVHLRLFSANQHGLALTQGAGNRFFNMVTVANDNHGAHIAWYGNAWYGTTAENNGGWGFNFAGFAETHDNDIFGIHDGGSNTLGLHNASGTNQVY